jgi:hypothetical protein
MALQLPSIPINYDVDIPDPSQAFLSAFKTGTAIAETRMAQEEAQRKAEQQQLISQAFQRLRQPGATAKDYADLSMMLPETQAKAVRESFSMLNTDQLQTAKTKTGQVFSAFKAGKPDIAIGILDQDIEAKRNSGDEYGAKFLETWRDVAKVNPQATEDFFGYMLADMPGGDKIIDSTLKIQDEKRTAKQFPILQKLKEAELRKATTDADRAEIETKYAERLQKANIARLNRDIQQQSEDRVQSSSIKPDGTVVIVTNKGLTRVIGADGVELTGQDRMDAVRDSEQFGADIQALRSGARTGGEIGQKEAQKAFNNIGKVRQNLSNLDAAVAALDAGANTGVISNKFPNWKASTIELRNIQNRLGLDVVGSVTFGALSEGELSLALETALPLNMNERQLRDWLIRKKDAQSKVADYLSEQARYLSVPGRTIGNWIEFAEKKYGGQQPTDQIGATGTAEQPTVAPAMPSGFRVIR